MAESVTGRKIINLLWWFFGVLVSFLLLLGAALVWWVPRHGEAWLDHTLRARIFGIIDRASVEGYDFRMEGLETDVRTGSLVITGVQLDYAPGLIDSLRNGSIQYLFAARADRIELRGLSFWRLLWANEFRVTAFELKSPTFKYVLSGAAMDLADPFARMDKGGGFSIALLSADTVLVGKATATVEDLGERLPVLQLSGLELQSHGINVFMGERHSGVRVDVGGADLQLDSLRTQLADGAQLMVGRIELSLSERSGRIIRIRHMAKRSDVPKADTLRRPLLDVEVDSLLMTDLDVDELISRQVLHLGHLAVGGLHVYATLDKTLSAGPSSPRALPPAALLEVGFPIRIDTLTVGKADVVYRERDGESGRWGTASFGQLKGRFLHIANEPDAIAAHPRITGEATGLLFDTASISVTYRAELDGSQDFEITATVMDLPLERLNVVTRPLLRLQVEGGRLERIHMTMEGNERKARGRMEVRYTDLLVRVEPGTPRAVHNSMFGNVLGTMLKETYGGGLTADRERKYSVDRDPDRALTTYLWHAVREGVARNLAPEAWDRMRSMLRTDVEQRKEQRAARRAKKRERE